MCRSPRGQATRKTGFPAVSAPPRRVHAPFAAAGDREIQKDKAEQYCELTLVQERKEALRRVREKISDRREARQDEGDRSREQADQNEYAPDQFEHARRTQERHEFQVVEGPDMRKAEEFRGAML